MCVEQERKNTGRSVSLEECKRDVQELLLDRFAKDVRVNFPNCAKKEFQQSDLDYLCHILSEARSLSEASEMWDLVMGDRHAGALKKVASPEASFPVMQRQAILVRKYMDLAFVRDHFGEFVAHF